MLTDGTDLLVLGGLGVDVAVRVPALPPPVADSTTVPVDLRIGNTGAGVALAARAIGLRVAVVDTIGDDPAAAVVRAALDRAGVESWLLPDPRGTRRELTARARFVHLSIMDWMLDLLPALVGTDRMVSTDLHDWDGASAYHQPFAGAADMVFVSGARLPEPDAVLAGILMRGRATLAAVTLGARGARLLEAGSLPVDVPAATPPAPVVDTNGAGDAFVAGFIAGHLHGWPAPDAIRYAASVAAAACTHHGMEYPSGLLPRP